MRRGLCLDVDECARLAPALIAAGRSLRDCGQHNAAAQVLLFAKEVVDVAEAFPPTRLVVTLATWCRRRGAAERTARRWAHDGKLPGAYKTPSGWMIPIDTAPPRTAG